MHTKEQLKKDLETLGIRRGDTVLMHSSFKSLGGVEEDAEGFFSTFLALLGAEGTLALPTLSYESVSREQPVFDIARTPSCVGYLTEYFRTQVQDVVRSEHPTHSCCAVGAKATYLTEAHRLDRTPVGPNSPFARLPKVGGKILILGSHPDHNTTLHGVEERIEPEYLFDRSAPVVYRVRDTQGNEREVTHLHHGFEFETVNYEQRYARVMDLLDDDEIRFGKVLDADCVLMDAAAVWREAEKALRKDPLYFVDIVRT